MRFQDSSVSTTSPFANCDDAAFRLEAEINDIEALWSFSDFSGQDVETHLSSTKELCAMGRFDRAIFHFIPQFNSTVPCRHKRIQKAHAGP